MTESLWLLTLTAASLGFIHTLIGPDHYIPFIMMSQAQSWSRAKMMTVTFLCGLGHVLSSILIGVIGIAFGTALRHLEFIESVRGEIAAWALIAFGLIYGLWGLKVAFQGKTHSHTHTHDDGVNHVHPHTHLFGRAHRHDSSQHKVMTTWALFTVFVLGPCEPLIPLLMYPAATESITGLVMVSGVFSLCTIGTMMGMVLIISSGINLLPLRTIERYTHAIAGGVIALSGLAIQFLGL